MQLTINDGEVKAMISLLDDTDQEIYQHVEDKLVKLGRNVIPMLEDAWSNAFDAVLQQRIENIVHKIQYETLLDELKAWIQSPEQDLLSGAILVARYQYPDLDAEKITTLITQIRKEIWLELNENLTSLESVNIINHVLFSRYGFSGNTANYHAPQNSYINCVLESKKGNPLALSVIYQVICQQLGLPVFGVNLPEHFILAYMDDTGNDDGKVLFYINAFSKGSVFGKQDIDQFVKRLNLDGQASFYNPCQPAEMIQRMVRNLMYSYQKLGDTEKVLEVTDMLALFGNSNT